MRDTSLLTFCKDKLAGLKLKYEPNQCSHCKTREGELRWCAKCHVARYCSKECQTIDWKAGHKQYCRETAMLKEMICIQSETDVKIEKKKIIADRLVFKAGETRVLHSDIGHTKMRVLDRNTIILRSYLKPKKDNIITLYDCIKGVEHQPVVMDMGPAVVVGQEAVSVGGSTYVATVTVCFSPPSKSVQLFQINFYPPDYNTLKPTYTYTVDTPLDGVGALHFTDGKLLVGMDPFPCIKEFDVSTFPIKPTGKMIQANEYMLEIDTIRTLMQNGEKRILTVQKARK